jgi:hypothetical protein
MLTPPELLMAQLMAVINAHMAAEPDAFKVIVFFPTARAAQFHAALARASGCSCYDLHSRLSQKQRDTAAAAFGSNPTGVIFASDVIARGLDFPDVSLVVQVGVEAYFFCCSMLVRTAVLARQSLQEYVRAGEDFPECAAGGAGGCTCECCVQLQKSFAEMCVCKQRSARMCEG